MDIAAQHGARCVVLAHHGVAVIDKVGLARLAALHPVEPPQGIVIEINRGRARSPLHQTVLYVIEIGVGPVRGQVAVGVVGEARPARALILVETVRGVSAGEIDMAID